MSRRARTRRSRGPAAAAAVAAGLVAVALVSQAIGGEGAASLAAVVDEVRTSELACPAPPGTADGADNDVTMVAPPGGAGPGVATLVDLGPGKGRARLEAPGRVEIEADGLPAQVARGVDGLAPGLAAELVTDVPAGPSRGLAAVSCIPAGGAAWFVGASTAAGRRDRLVLVNPEMTPALVDLRFWNEAGPVQAPNSTGIDVPAGATVEIPLDGVTAGSQRLAVAVDAVRGRVAAALYDLETSGVAARGFDWISPVRSPARTVVIPAVPAGELSRRLQVLAPGATDAIVRVRVLTVDNEFAPAGLDTFDLPAGQVADFDLDAAAAGQAVALVLSSDRPLLAAVRVQAVDGRGAKRIADVAYATAATELTAPATLPAAGPGGGYATRLMLVAPRGAASVSVQVVPATGRPGKPVVLAVPAGRLVEIDPAPDLRGAYSLVISPAADSGPVHAARVLRSGEVDLTIGPALPGRFTVTIPGIVPDLTAPLP